METERDLIRFRLKTRERYRQLRSAGKCVRCECPSGGKSECPACREKSRARYRGQVAAGVCPDCHRQHFGGRVVCDGCMARRESRPPKAKENDSGRE